MCVKNKNKIMLSATLSLDVLAEELIFFRRAKVSCPYFEINEKIIKLLTDLFHAHIVALYYKISQIQELTGLSRKKIVCV